MVKPPVLNTRLRLLVAGEADEGLLETHTSGPGDLWHSGLQRGFANALSELIYWAPEWWYLNNGPTDAVSVTWRADPEAFAIRPEVWERLGGFDKAYESAEMQVLDLAFRMIQHGGVPLHVPGLYPAQPTRKVEIPRSDIHLFFARNFKQDYGRYLCIRESLRTLSPWREWSLMRKARERARAIPAPVSRPIPIRPLVPAPADARVSVVIPTMRRQDYTRQYVEDLARQTLVPHEVIIVDATPEAGRKPGIYENFDPPVNVRVFWQTSLGSCRARNEGMRAATGDYILFGDDDIRVLPDYVENHVRFLETYHCAVTNGHDIRAAHHTDGLDKLRERLEKSLRGEVKAGLDFKFNNADTCVRREWIERCVGNDINFDGGYGEDKEFGLRITRTGGVVMFNPMSANLHLKPPAGGFRWWGSFVKQKKRKRAPWELNRRVGWIRPKPVPTTLYGIIKHTTPEQFREWTIQRVTRSWWPQYLRSRETTNRRLLMLIPRMLATPVLLLRLWISYGFARDLLRLGPRYE